MQSVLGFQSAPSTHSLEFMLYIIYHSHMYIDLAGTRVVLATVAQVPSRCHRR